jgi:hypothetical protein
MLTLLQFCNLYGELLMHAKLFVELMPADVKPGIYGCSRQLVTILNPQRLVRMDISKEN